MCKIESVEEGESKTKEKRENERKRTKKNDSWRAKEKLRGEMKEWWSW